MRAIRRTAMGAVLAALLSILISPLLAHADSYFDDSGQQVEATIVWEDPGVTLLSAKDVSALQQQIRAQANKPFYIAIMDNTRITAPNGELPGMLHAVVGRSGVYVVVTPKTFRAKAFGTPDAISGQAIPVASELGKQAASAHRKPDFKLISDYINAMRAISVPKNVPVADTGSNPQAAPVVMAEPSNEFPWLTAFGIACGSLLGVGLLLWFLVKRAKRKQQAEDARLRKVPDDTMSPTDWADSSSRFEKPKAQFYGDSSLHSQPSQPYPTTGSAQQPARHPTTNNDSYFGGGYANNGRFYSPGYYPSSNPFWEYLMWDSLLSHNQTDYDRDGYQEGFQDGQQQGQSDHSGNPPDQSTSDADWTTDAKTWSTDHGSDSEGEAGGANFPDSSTPTNVPEPDPTPVYQAPPSYDPPAQSDSGWGADSSDSGGWSSSGSDSGGSDAGGNDFA